MSGDSHGRRGLNNFQCEGLLEKFVLEFVLEEFETKELLKSCRILKQENAQKPKTRSIEII